MNRFFLVLGVLTGIVGASLLAVAAVVCGAYVGAWFFRVIDINGGAVMGALVGALVGLLIEVGILMALPRRRRPRIDAARVA